MNNKISNELVQQGYQDCPSIINNWISYKRQIIGYVDKKNGNHIIWVNFFLEDSEIELQNWREVWVDVDGGCSNYWSIKYNCSKDKLFEWVIN